jgi:hypothetical protein
VRGAVAWPNIAVPPSLCLRVRDQSTASTTPQRGGGAGAGGGGAGEGVASGMVVSAAGSMVAGSSVPASTPTETLDWLWEPRALQCPCCTEDYDAAGRLPVALACACHHTVCLKCAAVLAGVPRGAGLPCAPPPCPLCGLADGPGYDLVDCSVDPGLLLTVVGKATSPPKDM